MGGMMSLSPTELAVLGTLGGAAVAAASAILTTFINRKFEDRKHLREQIMRTAIDYWQKHHELIKAANNGKLSKIAPLDTYVVHICALMNRVMDTELTTANVAAIVEEAHQISKAAYEQAKQPT
jgi:hypothetical protein